MPILQYLSLGKEVFYAEESKFYTLADFKKIYLPNLVEIDLSTKNKQIRPKLDQEFILCFISTSKKIWLFCCLVKSRKPRSGARFTMDDENIVKKVESYRYMIKNIDINSKKRIRNPILTKKLS